MDRNYYRDSCDVCRKVFTWNAPVSKSNNWTTCFVTCPHCKKSQTKFISHHGDAGKQGRDLQIKMIRPIAKEAGHKEMLGENSLDDRSRIENFIKVVYC